MTILSTVADGVRKVFSIPPYTGSPVVKVNGSVVTWEAAGDFNLSLSSTPAASATVEIDYVPIDPTASVVPVTASRALTASDNGKTLDCSAGVVLTITKGLGNFGCAVRPAGVQIACEAGVTTNGTPTIVTTTARVSAINPTLAVDDYDVVGV